MSSAPGSRWFEETRYGVVPLAARAVGADRVHVAADYGPYGQQRDADVERALAEHDIELVRTGSPYAVAPGRLSTGAGERYQVFTPFSEAWAEHGWRGPVDPPITGSWVELDEDTAEIPDRAGSPTGLTLPRPASSRPAQRWQEFVGTDRRLRRAPGPARGRRHLRLSAHLK